jgi:hypothetical protein
VIMTAAGCHLDSEGTLKMESFVPIILATGWEAMEPFSMEGGSERLPGVLHLSRLSHPLLISHQKIINLYGFKSLSQITVTCSWIKFLTDIMVRLNFPHFKERIQQIKTDQSLWELKQP